jgi:inner membrane protein
LLDALTAYGTQLFLPFSNARMGLDCINVVDPFYTVPLLVGVSGSVWLSKKGGPRLGYNHWGLMISSLYLLFTFINKQGVDSHFKTFFEQNEVQVEKLLTMPVGMGNMKWYGVAKSRDSMYMQPYHILSDSIHPIVAFAIHDDYLNELDQEKAHTMRWFAKGFYTVEKENEVIRIYNLQVDMRGIVDLDNRKAPTVGYFEFQSVHGERVFSSGSWEVP